MFVKSLPETRTGEVGKGAGEASHSVSSTAIPGVTEFKENGICLGEIINLLFPFINQAPPGTGP